MGWQRSHGKPFHHCGHSVNGVSAIHTEILKHDVLKGFYALTPEKFNNKTNGVSHRRFLREANPALSKVITNAVGDGWMTNAEELSKLEQYADDPAVLDDIVTAKHEAKKRLAKYVKQVSGVELDPIRSSMFRLSVFMRISVSC